MVVLFNNIINVLCKEFKEDRKGQVIDPAKMMDFMNNRSFKTLEKPRLHNHKLDYSAASLRLRPIKKVSAESLLVGTHSQQEQPTKLSIFQYVISLILGLDAVMDQPVVVSSEDGSEASSVLSAPLNEGRVPRVFMSSSSQSQSQSQQHQKLHGDLKSRKLDRDSVDKSRRLLESVILDSWKGGKLLMQQIKRAHCDEILKERLVIYSAALQGKLLLV